MVCLQRVKTEGESEKLFRLIDFSSFTYLFRSSTAEEPPVMEEDPDLDDEDPLCNSFNSFCK